MEIKRKPERSGSVRQGKSHAEAILDLASSATTTAEQLAEITHYSFEINRLLASHPNASPEILRKITAHWSDEIIEATDIPDIFTYRIRDELIAMIHSSAIDSPETKAPKTSEFGKVIAKRLDTSLAVAVSALDALFRIVSTSLHGSKRRPRSTKRILRRTVDYFSVDDEARRDSVDECCRIAVQNPNISIDLLIKIGNRFPLEMLQNPALGEFLGERPQLFDETPNILLTPECPQAHVQSVIEMANRYQLLPLFGHPQLHPDIQGILDTDRFYQHDLNKLKQLADLQVDEQVRRYIEIYSDTSLPFCVPNFFPFDPKNPLHRIDDQVFCGFPFTSAKWPWPKDGCGDYMQPIAQVDLSRAGKLLECDLGNGLFQFWGGINSTIKCELITRIVPVVDLNDPLDTFYPEKAPWLVVETDSCSEWMSFDGCVHSAFNRSDLPGFGPTCCRVFWVKAGRMFYPDFYTRFTHPRSCDEDAVDEEMDESLAMDLDDQVSALGIPRGNFISDALGRKTPLWLGGYPSSIGNYWGCTSHRSFIFHHEEYGCLITCGAMFDQQNPGIVNFSTKWTCEK